jgi:hypothetical protein
MVSECGTSSVALYLPNELYVDQSFVPMVWS